MGSATRFFLLLTSPRPPLVRFRLPRLSPSSLATSFSASSSPLSRPPRLFHLLKSSSSPSSVDSQQLHTQATTYPFSSPSPSSSSSSSWPEWSRLLERLSDAGYFSRPLHQDDEIVSTHNLSQDFLISAAACLAFARDAPLLIRSLSTRDIEVLVQNVPPFLFLNGPHSAVKMTSFFEEDYFQPLESDQPCTVDLMRYLLCYASDFGASSHPKSLYDKELLASAVRNLFTQIANIIYNAMQPQPSASVTDQLPHDPAISFRQNIEMKRGDWICPGCNFPNFSRNVKCLECERVRPKRQLTGGEWECPQCDFYNYNKNTSCLRCDCKRPGEASINISNYQPGLKNGDYTNKVDIDSRLASNDEKSGRWFDKISQLDSSTGNSTIADDDFPEIMPLRKGVNRFVVSTRKTPLERRISNTQGTFGNEDTSQGNTSQTGGTLSPSLDDILGRTSAANTEDKIFTNAHNAAKESPENASIQPGYSRGSSSDYVPFVPLPADTFAKKPQSLKTEEEEENLLINIKESVTSKTSRPIATSSWTNQSAVSEESLLISQKPIQVDNKDKEKEKEQEQAEKSERWFKRVAELHDVVDLTSAISDEDFPEIMPMRKGENRFVVSKKKDRSLTSPMYKRKMAMEQSSNTNFVPFVPFPPDYFTKKNNEQPDHVVPSKATDATSGQIVSDEVIEKKDYSATTEHQQSTKENWNSTSSDVKLTERNDTDTWGANDGYGTNNYVGPQTTGNNSDSHANIRKDDGTKLPRQPENPNPNPRDSWTGKSLEGSAVKEIDPLDMSEEAKAERWFKRAAQIKDISELSQIPDEDFPSIMPMRKGVNRFVVSKRKTPLERRLTSPQYRRNLPVVSSVPFKKEDDNS